MQLASVFPVFTAERVEDKVLAIGRFPKFGSIQLGCIRINYVRWKSPAKSFWDRFSAYQHDLDVFFCLGMFEEDSICRSHRRMV